MREKKCYNPLNGRKDPNTDYVIFYGKKEYFRCKKLVDARTEFYALLETLKSKGDKTNIFLVKQRLTQKVLSSTKQELNSTKEVEIDTGYLNLVI